MADHVFEWDWCCMCGAFVRCPKCGNNSCNGGFGELEDGSKCDVCPQAYELQDKAYADGTVPEIDPKRKECPEMKWADAKDMPIDMSFDGPPAVLDFGIDASFPLDDQGNPV